MKDLNYYKNNCEEDYIKTPISVLRYITELEKKNEAEQLILSGVGSSLPDLAECNQASLDYATKKNNRDFFLIKQTFKDGVNWALNYVTRPK